MLGGIPVQVIDVVIVIEAGPGQGIIAVSTLHLLLIHHRYRVVIHRVPAGDTGRCVRLVTIGDYITNYHQLPHRAGMGRDGQGRPGTARDGQGRAGTGRDRQGQAVLVMWLGLSYNSSWVIDIPKLFHV